MQTNPLAPRKLARQNSCVNTQTKSFSLPQSGYNMIRLVAILVTSRPGNYTSKALALILDEFAKHERVLVDVIDPSHLTLLFPGQDGNKKDQEMIQEIVKSANGIIFATPEYHGSMSASAKLIIENLAFPSVLAGKPVVMMGVAAGGIGAIKTLEQLRLTLSHIGAIVLPFSVSVARVQKVFNKEGDCEDEVIEDQLRGLADHLLEYIDG